jgi:transcription-repair coupling factor (superfamily II helicase)
VSHFSLTGQLSAAGAGSDQAVRALCGGQRVDLSGLPTGALSLLLSRAAARPDAPPFVVLVSDADAAQRLGENLAFFAGAEQVLHYPGAETTPFVDVAPDRRAAMERLSTLFHLQQGLPFRFLILPAAAALRRVPPRSAIARRSLRLALAEELDRAGLIESLSQGGYLRVPLVEDPGSFAVRGALIDVYPPSEEYPLRIELDDELVASIRSFDPETQRTAGEVESISIHPVRDTMLGPEELQRARERVSDLCDAINMPSSKRRQLVDDIAGGRNFIGIECFLPAFYERLESLFEYLPENAHVLALDPHGIETAIAEELDHAARDHEARREKKAPVFELDELYLKPGELSDAVSARPLGVAHRLAIMGRPDDEEVQHLPALSPPSPEAMLEIAAEDQAALSAELKARRGKARGDDPLEPLARHVRRWLDEGMRVLLAARTGVQAQRLSQLLRGQGLRVGKPRDFDPASDTAGLSRPGDGRPEVVVGTLAEGFVLPGDALCLVTEEEIFGSRAHRRARRRKEVSDTSRPFVADLSELAVGDYVVHVDHGIGIYRGIDRQQLPVTRFEALQGMSPRRVEVLVVEYAGGDKLYLPVTRLNQIEKLSSKEGHKPKLDKLGGQTFARTKARVKRSVQQLADELLALYAARAARERPPYPERDELYAQFEAHFPYEETPDQARAIDEVMDDLRGTHPMDRLVCGDVGFGKTEVALRAAFRVAMAGHQVAVLCPTTVLAQQHYNTFRDRLEEYPVRVGMLSRFVPRKEQTKVVRELKEGKLDIVVGTHRLLSKDVHFEKLGLLIVDEEQRFGVAHKERIKKLRTEVDVLTLSATPIPRTLHLAIGGMRELSLIATPPSDRRAIRTFVTRWDDQVITEAIDRELGRGGQVFFIHNRIDGLYERAVRLQELIPRARIAVAHGRLKEATLERLMTGFVEGEYDILASTAIVENGLDIPQANTILIDRADIFGLSQLYQLRGRVGRSRERAYCYLISPPPSQLTDEARARIEALERFSQLGSGFQIASLDMELRGAGDLLGEEQSGNIASVGFDLFVHMLQEAVAELRGQTLVHEVDPELTFNVEHHIPEDYVADVGLRLSFYKRLASAPDEEAVHELATEMEDRFGKPPAEVLTLVRLMSLKPGLRRLRVLGCEATGSRVTLHFREDTPLDPGGLATRVAETPGMQLTPDMRMVRRFDRDSDGDALDQAERVVQDLLPLVRGAEGDGGATPG